MKRQSYAQCRLKKDIRSCRTALLFLAIYFIAAEAFFHTTCPLVILAGVPCPGCGLTRAAFYLLTGRPAEAWNQNATIFLWLPLLIAGACFRYIRGKIPSFYFPAAVLAAILTFVNYGWRLFHGTLASVSFEGLLKK